MTTLSARPRPVLILQLNMIKTDFWTLSSSVWSLKPRYSNINVLKAFRLRLLSLAYDHALSSTTPNR